MFAVDEWYVKRFMSRGFNSPLSVKLGFCGIVGSDYDRSKVLRVDWTRKLRRMMD